MDLIIVESPTKAKTLSRFLGKEYSVEATMGHVKDLPKSTLGINIEKNFKPEYVEVEKRAEEIANIKSKAKKADVIYIASDPDREGEAIAAHVKEIIGNGKTKRIVFHEITQEALEKALAEPRDIDNNLVDAQIARRVLDRLVGYQISPILWRKVRRGLSAGRVQSVVVKLIVERERQIKAFKPIEYWEIIADLSPQAKKETFAVRLSKINDKIASVTSRGEAEAVVKDLNKSDYNILKISKREVRKRPYAPFTTSTMTQSAARTFGWSAKRTMSIAQSLYEEGLITYHRTDSTNIAASALTKAREHIKKEYGQSYLSDSPRLFKVKTKNAQEAHEAIRPTGLNSKIEVQKSKYSADLEKLYSLIWKRFIACQMAESIYDETAIDVKASQNQGVKYYVLHAAGSTLKFDGWLKLYPRGEGGETILPSMSESEPLNLIKVNSIQKFTEPPARFNEASLIKTLEKLGIGRPSTYAPTISTIQVRKYVEKSEGKFTPTLVGIAVNDFLVSNFADILEYQFTAEMEDDLDNVAKGEKKWEAIMKSFYTPFKKRLDFVTKNAKRVKIPTEKTGRKCPECKDGELVIRIGRFGKFISCSRFPDCKYTEKFVDKIGMKCPECKTGEVIIKNTKKWRKFYGCSRYPECKWASWKNPKITKDEGNSENKKTP